MSSGERDEGLTIESGCDREGDRVILGGIGGGEREEVGGEGRTKGVGGGGGGRGPFCP